MARIYLDNNASTSIRPEVFEAMQPYFLEHYGNASSAHAYGQEARGAVEEARALVAALLKGAPGEIVFTSGGTESDNLAVIGAARALRSKGRPRGRTGASPPRRSRPRSGPIRSS